MVRPESCGGQLDDGVHSRGRNHHYVLDPAGGVPGRENDTPPFVFGSAICSIINPVTEDFYTPNFSMLLYNVVEDDIAPNAIGKAEFVGGKYVIHVASCGDFPELP